jgi:hypothetical protein
VTDWVLNHLILFVIWTLCGRTSLTILQWSFEATKHASEEEVKNGEEQTDKNKSIHSGPLLAGPQSYESHRYLSS